MTEETQGLIDAPDEAVEGTEIEVSIEADQVPQEVQAYLFSDPIGLGEHISVDENDTFTVSLPDGVTGEHQIAAYNGGNEIIGWDTINILAADDSEEDNAVAITPDDSEEAPANTEELAATGSESGLAGFIAAAIAAAGALALGVSVLRRREKLNAKH